MMDIDTAHGSRASGSTGARSSTAAEWIDVQSPAGSVRDDETASGFRQRDELRQVEECVEYDELEIQRCAIRARSKVSTETMVFPAGSRVIDDKPGWR